MGWQEDYIKAEAAELYAKLDGALLFGKPVDLSDPDIRMLAAYHLGKWEHLDRAIDEVQSLMMGRRR